MMEIYQIFIAVMSFVALFFGGCVFLRIAIFDYQYGDNPFVNSFLATMMFILSGSIVYFSFLFA